MPMAVVNEPFVPYYDAPQEGPRRGELLFGAVVEAAPAAPGWCRVPVPGGDGYVAAGALVQDGAQVDAWQTAAKQVARSPWLDVMDTRGAGAACLACLPRGALVHPLGAPVGGWLQVGLPDGRYGQVRVGNLMPYLTDWRAGDDKLLREAIATTAMSYLGAQYRGGGRTPQGVDAAGLVLLAGGLNGVALPCGTAFAPGSDAHEIDRAQLAMGDLVYFRDHVGIYLGEEKFIHATSQEGSDGVVINSLSPASPFYREDLAENLLCCASIFD